jgi:septal ring factor EnvC (AmiA/AmiB activator)
MQSQLNRVEGESATMWQDQKNFEVALDKQSVALAAVREELEEFENELRACRSTIATLKADLTTVTDQQTALHVTVEELQTRRSSGRRRVTPSRFEPS